MEYKLTAFHYQWVQRETRAASCVLVWRVSGCNPPQMYENNLTHLHLTRSFMRKKKIHNQLHTGRQGESTTNVQFEIIDNIYSE